MRKLNPICSNLLNELAQNWTQNIRNAIITIIIISVTYERHKILFRFHKYKLTLWKIKIVSKIVSFLHFQHLCVVIIQIYRYLGWLVSNISIRDPPKSPYIICSVLESSINLKLLLITLHYLRHGATSGGEAKFRSHSSREITIRSRRIVVYSESEKYSNTLVRKWNRWQ